MFFFFTPGLGFRGRSFVYSNGWANFSVFRKNSGEESRDSGLLGDSISRIDIGVRIGEIVRLLNLYSADIELGEMRCSFMFPASK